MKNLPNTKLNLKYFIEVYLSVGERPYYSVIIKNDEKTKPFFDEVFSIIDHDLNYVVGETKEEDIHRQFSKYLREKLGLTHITGLNINIKEIIIDGLMPGAFPRSTVPEPFMPWWKRILKIKK